jgi:hypothetical protein
MICAYICRNLYSRKIMELNYQTVDGHYFLHEDFIFYVKWKVEDLKSQGYSDDDILCFDNCDGWYDYAISFLQEINNCKIEITELLI